MQKILNFRVQLLIAALIIIFVSTWISLSCWESYGICETPGNVGWIKFFVFNLTLLTGPLSGLYMPLLSKNELNFSWLVLVFIGMALTYCPILYYLKIKKFGPILLGFGVFFWLMSAWLFNVGIWI